jgi:hypothetical protein
MASVSTSSAAVSSSAAAPSRLKASHAVASAGAAATSTRSSIVACIAACVACVAVLHLATLAGVTGSSGRGLGLLQLNRPRPQRNAVGAKALAHGQAVGQTDGKQGHQQRQETVAAVKPDRLRVLPEPSTMRPCMMDANVRGTRVCVTFKTRFCQF